MRLRASIVLSAWLLVLAAMALPSACAVACARPAPVHHACCCSTPSEDCCSPGLRAGCSHVQSVSISLAFEGCSVVRLPAPSDHRVTAPPANPPRQVGRAFAQPRSRGPDRCHHVTVSHLALPPPAPAAEDRIATPV